MMYTNENIPNPYLLILEQLYNMERKLDELLTVQHATAYLRISPSTLYQLTSRSPFYEKRQAAVF